MLRIITLFCFISIPMFSQTKTKKIEIYKSPTMEFVNAEINIVEDIEKDILIDFYGRDHQYTHIDSYLAFFRGTPKDFFIYINKLKEAFNEDVDIKLTIDNNIVTVQKIAGKKVISLSLKNNSGYRLFNQKSIEKIIDKFKTWANEKQIDIE